MASPMEQAFMAAVNPTEEQRLENDVEKRNERVEKLIDRFEQGPVAEWFATPESRLSKVSEGILALMIGVNARSRGMEPRDLLEKMETGEEGRGAVVVDYIPQGQGKLDALAEGEKAIKEYIENSEDDILEKLDAVAMAVEMLTIRTHIFNDGNGRTSRFLAEMIRNGLDNREGLIATATEKFSPYYRRLEKSREQQLSYANNDDLMLDEEDRAQIRRDAESLPSEVQVIGSYTRKILEDKEFRESLKSEAEERRRKVGARVVEIAR